MVLDEELAEEGRTRSDVRITVCPPAKLDAAMVEDFRQLGVDELLTAYHRQQHDSLAAWLAGVVPFVDQLRAG